MTEEELWVGDHLKLRYTGEIWKYNGSDGSGKLLLQVGVKRIKVSWDEVYHKTFNDESVSFQKMTSAMKKQNSIVFCSPSIDLHIAVAEENIVGNWPGAELHYQKTKCRKYINRAIVARLNKVEIIHGKGAGILKAEVMEILRNEAKIERVEELHSGALIAWLR